MQAVNGRFGRCVALSHIAKRLDDFAAAKYAMYLLMRTALLRFAQGKFIQHMYDEKFQTIEVEPGWMFRLTTGSGNGGGQAKRCYGRSIGLARMMVFGR